MVRVFAVETTLVVYKYNLEHLSNVYVFHTKALTKYWMYLYCLKCI